jgi:hypothetical protein
MRIDDAPRGKNVVRSIVGGLLERAAILLVAGIIGFPLVFATGMSGDSPTAYWGPVFMIALTVGFFLAVLAMVILGLNRSLFARNAFGNIVRVLASIPLVLLAIGMVAFVITAAGMAIQDMAASHSDMADDIPGLRNEVGLALENWGPKTISSKKRILASVGAYDGPIDSSIEPGFALAVQRFYDDFIQRCRDGSNSDSLCKDAPTSDTLVDGTRPPLPAIDLVISRSASGELKEEAGRLTQRE